MLQIPSFHTLTIPVIRSLKSISSIPDPLHLLLTGLIMVDKRPMLSRLTMNRESAAESSLHVELHSAFKLLLSVPSFHHFHVNSEIKHEMILRLQFKIDQSTHLCSCINLQESLRAV